MLVIIGTVRRSSSVGTQLIVIDTTFESRVTVVIASITNCQNDPLAAATLVVRTFPDTRPPTMRSASSTSSTSRDSSQSRRRGIRPRQVHTRGDAPHVTVGAASTNDDAGERKRCAPAGATINADTTTVAATETAK